MSATYGTFRLIYEDASWFLGKALLLYIINQPGLLSGHPLIWIRHSVLFQAPRFSLSRSMGSWGSKAFYLLLSHELKC